MASTINDEKKYSASDRKEYFKKAGTPQLKKGGEIRCSGPGWKAEETLGKFQNKNQTIFYSDNFEKDYSELVNEEKKYLPLLRKTAQE